MSDQEVTPRTKLQTDPMSVFSKDTLAGKVAVVTGGGTGMGEDICHGFASVGATVVPLSRNMDHLKPVAEAIESRGGKAMPLVCDVRDPEQVENAMNKVKEEFGGLDILVNSAAGNFRCPSIELSPNAWRTVIDIDLNGTFFCSQAAARIMIPAGGGVMLNITGAFIRTHGEQMSHAAAAKSGIWNLTRTLAKEWGPKGIRVNSLSPGPIDTYFGARAMGREGALQEIADGTPIGRMGQQAEITAAATFLVSDGASFITGADLDVDGGQSWAGFHLPL